MKFIYPINGCQENVQGGLLQTKSQKTMCGPSLGTELNQPVLKEHL